METPEKKLIVIPPLTSQTNSREPYRRYEVVEDELRSVLPLCPAEWTKARTRLKSESLIFLSRYIRRHDDHVSGRLQLEINARTVRMAKRWIYGFDKEATEFIASEVEAEIMVLLLAEVPSRQSEYLEIAFGQAVYRHTKNAVDRFKNTPLAHKGEVVQATSDEDGADEVERPLERIPDRGPGPYERCLENETEALWAAWVQKALRFVSHPKHRETIILRYLKEWPITSKDADQSCLTRHFKVSARQIQNWIETALKQMKKGMMGEGYDAAKSFI